MVNEDTDFRTADTLEKSSTPYGDLTTVDRDNRIDISAERPLSEQSDVATAGVTHDAAESRFRIRANAGTESLETLDSLQYTPGYIAEIGIALRIPVAPTGDQEVRWGYWDGSEGAYFGWDSEGVFVETQRNGVRQGKVYEEEWNQTPLTPPIDAETVLQNGSISRLILALYNYGNVGFELYQRDKPSNTLESDVIHAQRQDGKTTITKQDNPLRVEVDNPDASDFDVFVADRQASVRGQFTASRRIKGERLTDVSLSGTTFVPILSFRRKEAFKTVNTRLFDLNVAPDTDIYLQVRENAGSTADADYATPQDVTASETGVEVDTTPTADIGDGYYVFQTQFEGGRGGSASLGGFDEVDLQLKDVRPMTIFARTVSGSGGTLNGFNMNWAENW